YVRVDEIYDGDELLALQDKARVTKAEKAAAAAEKKAAAATRAARAAERALAKLRGRISVNVSGKKRVQRAARDDNGADAGSPTVITVPTEAFARCMDRRKADQCRWCGACLGSEAMGCC